MPTQPPTLAHFRSRSRSLALLVVALGSLHAQNAGTIVGVVTDPRAAVVPQATVVVENVRVNFQYSTQTAADGTFRVANLPLQQYVVRVEKPGFQTAVQPVSVRSTVPVTLDVALSLQATDTKVEVTMSQVVLIDPEATGTRTQMNQSDMERLASNRGLEAALLTFPGFAQNANGAIHPRGAHNQMTFLLDGMPITEQLTGAFANAVDPNVVQTVELFTGNIPAEYGNKVSAVANVTTRSGLGTGRPVAGSVMVSAAQFDMLQGLAQMAGEHGKWGYAATFNAMKSNRYLDQVSLDNLHNGGHNQRGFLRVDYRASERDSLRLNLMSGDASFQLANLRSQHANGMDQRQRLRDWGANLGWIRVLNPRTTFETTTSYRVAGSQLFPSAGDTPVTASQARRTTTFNSGFRLNFVSGVHTIRFGGDLQVFPVREHFSFAVTDSDFNVPGSPDFVETLLQHDLTRGGTWFHFGKKRTGHLASGFLQDNIRLGRWQFSLGLRYDAYGLLVNAAQWQPRVGLSYHLKETRTVFRASYNRLFQPPPTENLLMSNSQESAVLVAPNIREQIGGALALIRPERTNFYELGLQQALGPISLDASYYHKSARDQQDNNNFFDTGLIFPTSLQRIRVNGAEGRIVLPRKAGFGVTFSATHARAVTTPPFTGGLFIGQEAVELLSSGPFLIDHDQTLSLQSLVTYENRRGWFATVCTRYDSGLVTNPSDPAEVAADPDFFDLLPYVRLNQSVPRTQPRTVTDVVAGYVRTVNDRRRWEASIQVQNLTDVTALYNFQSVFVGTRVVQPRTLGMRLRWYF